MTCLSLAFTRHAALAKQPVSTKQLIGREQEAAEDVAGQEDIFH